MGYYKQFQFQTLTNKSGYCLVAKEIMKASEALNIYENVVADNLDEVYQTIKKASESMERVCFYYKPLSKAQLHTLVVIDKYTVSNETDRDGGMFKIEW